MSDRADWIAGLQETAAGIDRGARIPYRVVFKHGTLEAGLYTPGASDLQQPHTRDEAYVVAAGNGTFVRDNERVPFAPGDFIFVPAGMAHRFEDYSADLAVWVVFYGPEGGE